MTRRESDVRDVGGAAGLVRDTGREREIEREKGREREGGEENINYIRKEAVRKKRAYSY